LFLLYFARERRRLQQRRKQLLPPWSHRKKKYSTEKGDLFPSRGFDGRGEKKLRAWQHREEVLDRETRIERGGTRATHLSRGKRLLLTKKKQEGASGGREGKQDWGTRTASECEERLSPVRGRSYCIRGFGEREVGRVPKVYFKKGKTSRSGKNFFLLRVYLKTGRSRGFLKGRITRGR